MHTNINFVKPDTIPCNIDAVNVLRAIFDSGEQTHPDFRSGVNGNAHAQQVDHQHHQTFDEDHLEMSEDWFRKRTVE